MRMLQSAVFLASASLIFASPFAHARNKHTTLMEAMARESEEMLTPAPKDNESCFTPDEPCAAKLIKFIESANSTIDIAIFAMTDRKIAEAIAKMSKTVKVRVVVNRKLVKDDSAAFDIVKYAGVPVRVGKQKGIMHDKFTIIDGKRLETGSFNYTYAAGNSNQENQLYVSTPSVLERFTERFEKMWKLAKH